MRTNDFVPFNKPYIAGKELFYISQSVISNTHISGDGPFTKLCQEWLETTLATPKALLTHSCTAALEMSAILTGIEPGDEVIMPSFTFVSTANAFVMRGAVPVFVDIREDNLNMDENIMAQAVTEKTKAVVPVHYAGVPCEMNAIVNSARDNGLWIIEDAAQALLSSYEGKYLGTIGDVGCLSFHETKNIISGEGGAILVNNDDLIEKAEIIWEKGTNRKKFFRGEVDKYTWVDIGSSYLPSDMVAAFLWAQFEMAEHIIGKRCKILETYHQNLSELQRSGYIRLPRIENNGTCNGHIFYILTSSLDERNRLIQHMKSHGVYSVFHYVPLHSSPAGKRYGRVFGSMEVTDEYSQRILRLPMFYEMTEEQVLHVNSVIKEFYI